MRLAALAVLLFDHRGYGRSNGTPNEQGTYLDAQAACDYLTNTKGLLPKSIVIIGESLGDHDTEFPVSKPKLIEAHKGHAEVSGNASHPVRSEARSAGRGSKQPVRSAAGRRGTDLVQIGPSGQTRPVRRMSPSGSDIDRVPFLIDGSGDLLCSCDPRASPREVMPGRWCPFGRRGRVATRSRSRRLHTLVC